MKEKYKLVLNLVVLFAVFCCLQTSTQASNFISNRIINQNLVEIQQDNFFDDDGKILAVCQSTPKIPGGFVIIGQGNVNSCRDNSIAQPEYNAWFIKEPSKVDQVCQGSPIPDGYIVSGKVKISDCPGGSYLTENTNGWIIKLVE